MGDHREADSRRRGAPPPRRRRSYLTHKSRMLPHLAAYPANAVPILPHKSRMLPPIGAISCECYIHGAVVRCLDGRLGDSRRQAVCSHPPGNGYNMRPVMELPVWVHAAYTGDRTGTGPPNHDDARHIDPPAVGVGRHPRGQGCRKPDRGCREVNAGVELASGSSSTPARPWSSRTTTTSSPSCAPTISENRRRWTTWSPGQAASSGRPSSSGS